MRIFANLFLNLFLADGLFSLLDELTTPVVPIETLSEVRSVLAAAAIVAALLLYPCLAIDRRLPKKLLLPLTLFVLGCPFSSWLVPAVADFAPYGLCAAALQVALVLALSHRFRCQSGGGLRLPDALFTGPLFSLRQTLLFAGAHLVALPPVLLLLAYNGTNAWLGENTAGFMRLAPDGVHMVERVYRRGDRTVRLAGMIHVGEKEYYDGLAGSVTPGRTLVLAEGISDNADLLTARLDYGRMAGFLGLTPQDRLLFPGRVIEEDELTAPRPDRREDRGAAGARPADILRADLDTGDFRPPTINLLNALGRQLEESPSFVSGVLAFNSWADRNMTPELYEVVTDDVLHRRNRVVLGHLDAALPRYETVIIPWGALHMKEIEGEVLRRGFRVQEQRERVSIGFSRLLTGKR